MEIWTARTDNRELELYSKLPCNGLDESPLKLKRRKNRLNSGKFWENKTKHFVQVVLFLHKWGAAGISYGGGTIGGVLVCLTEMLSCIVLWRLLTRFTLSSGNCACIIHVIAICLRTCPIP